MKPIVSFNFKLNGKSISYHTDGIELFGPLTSREDTFQFEEMTIYVSYCHSYDEETYKNLNQTQFWFTNIFYKQFDRKEDFEDAIADIILIFPQLYEYITKGSPYEEIGKQSNDADWKLNCITNRCPTISELRKSLA